MVILQNVQSKLMLHTAWSMLCPESKI